MDQGATIGCDRFGLDMFTPTADRVRTITALCAQGCADRIVLSHDVSCYMDFFSGEATYSMLRQAVPNWNFLHISQDVLPALRKQGVTEGQFAAMLDTTGLDYLREIADAGSLLGMDRFGIDVFLPFEDRVTTV